MQIINSFAVPISVEQAWDLLTDVETIAPCLPGAFLTGAHDGRYTGGVQVKVGPITAEYQGSAEFVELDVSSRCAVLKAQGSDARGRGNASALITAKLAPDGTGTSVSVVTDLTISGRLAQFGRGVISEISSRLLDEFVSALQNDILGHKATTKAVRGQPPQFANPLPQAPRARAKAEHAPRSVPATVVDISAESWPDDERCLDDGPIGGGSTHAGRARVAGADDQSLDLGSTMLAPIMRRALPVVAVIVGIALTLARRRRSRTRPV